MSWSPQQFREWELRNTPKTRAPSEAAEREVGKGGLQEQIRQWCFAQWPRWKLIQARSDQPSTIALGANDMTIFAPGGRILLVECKAKGGKISLDQAAWIKELEILGHTVHVVWSFDEFLSLVQEKAPSPSQVTAPVPSGSETPKG